MMSRRMQLGRRTPSVSLAIATTCALALGFAGTGRAQQGQLCPLEGETSARVVCLVAQIDGEQSVAINSTPLETRPGTGRAEVVLNLDTLELAYVVQYEGIRTDDFTGPDLVPSDPANPSGADIQGAGVSLMHFHVGARGVNGPIPVGVIDNTGPAIGVIASEPPMIQTTGAGLVIGRVNLQQLADENGVLLNGVRLGDEDETCTDPMGAGCALIPALLSDNTYFNIHSLNNPFGTIRGQMVVTSRLNEGSRARGR